MTKKDHLFLGADFGTQGVGLDWLTDKENC